MSKVLGSVCVLFTAALFLGCHEEIGGAGDETTDQGSEVFTNRLSNITILGEEGYEIDSHRLQQVLPDKAGAVIRLELRDTEGVVALLSESRLNDGEIVIPAFRVMPNTGLMTVDVYLDDRLYGGVDVYTTAVLPEIPPGMEQAVLERGERSYLIDLALTEGVSSPRISGQLSKDGSSQQSLSDCGNGISGPGVGRWLSSSPGPFGQRFSYCPESVPTLNWAVQGDREMDALYNQYWGCTSALKNPNNCTTTVSASGVGVINWCCGFPWYTPSWINPTTDPYFPDCPLTN